MQTFPQYGLTITLLNKGFRDEYMELKADLEEIGRLACKAPAGVRTVLLPDGAHWLTVCSTGKDAFLGIYNDVTKQISQDVLYDSPVITKRNRNTLKRRVESFVNNGLPMHHTEIERAWKALFEEKKKTQERDVTRDEQER